MMKVRFETTAQGEMAILRRKDYEALVARANEAQEDAGTARLVSNAHQQIAAGGLLLPKEIVDRLASGESAIRVLREWRGCTQSALSVLTGIAQGHISDIENGRRTGAPKTLRILADALKVPLDLIA
jgi:hypothetical protein